jgi:hypothetical protein
LPVALSIGVTIGVVLQTCGAIDHIFGELRENHKRNSVGGEMLESRKYYPRRISRWVVTVHIGWAITSALMPPRG